MKEQDQPGQQPNKRDIQEQQSHSEFLKPVQHGKNENDPHADRTAKTERKGSGQQQGSSGGPINS